MLSLLLMVVDGVTRHPSTESGPEQKYTALWRAPGTVYACLYWKSSVLEGSSDPKQLPRLSLEISCAYEICRWRETSVGTQLLKI